VKQNKRYVFCEDDLENGGLFTVQRNGRELEGLLPFFALLLTVCFTLNSQGK
jgi:hypothetical protein